MFSKQLIALTAALVFATSALASARLIILPDQRFAQPDSKRHAVVAGIVHTDGTIAQGTGFTVNHSSTGVYIVKVPGGTFPKCPSIIVTGYTLPASAPIADVYSNQCNSGPVTVEIHMFANSGGLQDNGFNFVMNET